VLGLIFSGPLTALAITCLVAIAWVGFEANQFEHFEALLQGEKKTSKLYFHWAQLSSWLQRFTNRQALQANEANQRLTDFLHAIQVSPNAVIMLDAQRRVTWSNQQAANLLGVKAQTDELQLITNIVRDPVFVDYIQGNQFSQECLVDGALSTSKAPLKLSIQLFEYGQDQSLLLARDVTGLERADAIRRDFVANVSHEMRTPLTVVHGFIETLQTLPLERPDQLKYLHSMGQQTRRMDALLTDLITLAKLESVSNAALEPWVSLGVIGERVAVTTKLTSDKNQVQWQLPSGIELAGDEGQIESALSNLVTNAIRYSDVGSPVLVSCLATTNGGLEITVKDSGVGIAREHLTRITERFYRVDKGRSRDTGGTGLGLAIVKHVLTRHEAHLRIESQLGVGSTFTIEWPAHRTRIHQTELSAAAQGA
jgi:two-component system, OmpR family, phosphate regulon sensor histidine kinase PhoR